MNTVKKILMIIASVLAIALITLSILGAKERRGYIEVVNKIEGEFIQSSSTDTNWGWVNGVHHTEKAVLFSTDVRTKVILNMAQYLSSGDKTLEINEVFDWGGAYLKNATDLKDFEYPNKIYALDKDRNVLNDVNIYQVKVRYYSKVFRNSDIYGVYLKTNNLPEYIKSIKFDEVGSPFGVIVSSKELNFDEKIDNISYVLKVKSHAILIVFILFILSLLFLIYKYLIINYKFLIIKINNIKYINYILSSLIFICIVIFITRFLRYDIYNHDDFAQSFFYTNNIFNIIKNADHGRYFSWIYMKLVVHGSMILERVHPNMTIIPKIVTGINIALLSFIVSLFATKPFGKKVSPFFFLCSFLSLMIIYSTSISNIIHYNQHFAYQSNLIWFFWGWLTFACYFLNNKIPENKDLGRNIFLAFMLGVTAHFNLISSIGIILILLLYTLIYYIPLKNIIMALSLKTIVKNTKSILIPLLAFILGAFLYFSAPHFKSLLKQRSPSGSDFFITRILKLIPDFILEYLRNIFINYGSILLLISFLMIVIIFFRVGEKKKLKVFLFSLAIIIGSLFFNASLIISGKTYYDTVNFWIVHPDLKTLTRMMFLSSVFILVGYFLSKKNIDFGIKTIVGSFIIICLIIVYKLSPVYNTFNADYFKKQRSNWYVTEKIYRFYSLHKKEAVLPANYVNSDGSFYHNELYNSSTNKPIDWTGFFYINNNYRLIYYNDMNLGKSNLKDYYVPYHLTNREIALEIFSNMGGVLTEEEVKNADFNRLFNEDFVLNMSNKKIKD